MTRQKQEHPKTLLGALLDATATETPEEWFHVTRFALADHLEEIEDWRADYVRLASIPQHLIFSLPIPKKGYVLDDFELRIARGCSSPWYFELRNSLTNPGKAPVYGSKLIQDHRWFHEHGVNLHAHYGEPLPMHLWVVPNPFPYSQHFFSSVRVDTRWVKPRVFHNGRLDRVWDGGVRQFYHTQDAERHHANVLALFHRKRAQPS